MPTYTVHAAKTNLSKAHRVGRERAKKLLIVRGKKLSARAGNLMVVPLCALCRCVRRAQGQAEAPCILLLRGPAQEEEAGRGARTDGGAVIDDALIRRVEGDERIMPKRRRLSASPAKTSTSSAATAWEIASKACTGNSRRRRRSWRGFCRGDLICSLSAVADRLAAWL